MKSHLTSPGWRKAVAVVASAAAMLSMFAIGAGTAGAAENDGKVVVSRVAKNGDKGYLEVDGKPFLMHGVQFFGEWQIYGSDKNPIPTDQKNPILSQDWLENGFEKTKAAGFDTIQIELAWNQIQPTSEGQYDWTLLDKYVEWAKKYDLKIDIVWWGINGCGGGIRENTVHGFMADIPDYLEADKYWGFKNNGGENEVPYLPNDSDPTRAADADYLFGEERKAVTAMFDHLAQVDTTHQTILFQIWNELNWNGWKDGHNKAQKNEWLRLADELGKAVKDSDYEVATRLNYRGNSIDSRSVLDKYENIDFSGPDAYTSSVSNMANIVKDTANKSDIAYIPETFSGGDNLVGVTATILANGGFVDFWQLNESWAGKMYSLYGIPDNGYEEYTDWKLGTIPKMPEASQKLARFNTVINKMGAQIAVAAPADMAGFNSDTDMPASGYTGSKTIAGKTVSFASGDDADAIGFALRNENDGAYLLASDSEGGSTFNLGAGVSASVGSYDDDGNWTGEPREVAADGTISIGSGELIRVIDASALSQTLDAGKSFKEADYTPESWKAYAQARKDAEQVLANPNATQIQLNDAAKTLAAAQDALVPSGRLTVVDPASLTVIAGTADDAIQGNAPKQVNVRAKASNPVRKDVTWDWRNVDTAPLANEGGRVSVPGTVTLDDGATLDATLTVYATAEHETNIAASYKNVWDDGHDSTDVGATFDGNTTNKGYTTWKSSGYSNFSLRPDYADAHNISKVKVYFYKDGNRASWSKNVSVKVWSVADNAWVPFGKTVDLSSYTQDGDAPVVEFTVDKPIAAKGVDIYGETDRYVSLSEVEIYAKDGTAVPASDASLADLRVDGSSVDGFNADKADYDVTIVHDAEYPLVQGLSRDTAAKVTVDQASDTNGGKATVSVTPADGNVEATKTYTVTFARVPKPDNNNGGDNNGGNPSNPSDPSNPDGNGGKNDGANQNADGQERDELSRTGSAIAMAAAAMMVAATAAVATLMIRRRSVR
ncbi:beta-galactosidase [Bifidobacterium aesculapii]|uniref:beta-galactosidase n=1 Tax=Bifidobacterium aesculapii TaxID=1329411 RepID=UPI0006E21EC3|nr:beta-galactosidase [Bifidobacterium aesculapii]